MVKYKLYLHYHKSGGWQHVTVVFLCMFGFLMLPYGNAVAVVATRTNQIYKPIKGTVSADYNLVNSDDEDEIIFGTSMPLTGGVSMLGRDFTYGVNMVFNKLNRSGGIGRGKLVKLASHNDKYDPAITAKNIHLLSAQTSIFMGLLGTESLLAVWPLVETKQMALFFPAVGSAIFRKNSAKWLVHYRASAKREVEALIDYAINEKKRRQIAVFYEGSEWGEGVFKAITEVLRHYGLSVHSQASYPSNTVNVLDAVKTISKSKPNAIICVAQSRPAYNFIQQVVNEGLSNTIFLGLGELAPIQRIIRKSRGVELVLSSVVPDPWNSELPIAKQFRRDMKKYLPNRKISQFLFEGYMASSVMVTALKRIGEPLILGRLVKRFESLRKVSFGGISLNFDSSDRSLCQDVWLNTGSKKEWLKFIGSKKTEPKGVVNDYAKSTAT